jgi:hypothetical protein
MQLDSLYLVSVLGVNLLNLIGAPVRPLTVKGTLGLFKRKFVPFLHVLSGKVNRLAYGTSVLQAGGAGELVDAVTVIVVAEGVKVMMLVTVLAERVCVVVLVQNSVLLQPVGQRWFGPMVQAWSKVHRACTSMGTTARRAVTAKDYRISQRDIALSWGFEASHIKMHFR